jgi:hypothetical protein
MIRNIAAATILAASAFGLAAAPALAAPALAAPSPEPPPPSPSSGATAKPLQPTDTAATARCGITGPNRDPSVGGFTGNNVRIHTGPSTHCTAVGEGSRGQRLDYYCYTGGDGTGGAATWTYLRDLSTGKNGWVNDAFLTNYGSFYHC